MRERLLKAQYKSEALLMTCEAELHCWVSRMVCPMVSHMDSSATYTLLLLGVQKMRMQ